RTLSLGQVRSRERERDGGTDNGTRSWPPWLKPTDWPPLRFAGQEGSSKRRRVQRSCLAEVVSAAFALTRSLALSRPAAIVHSDSHPVTTTTSSNSLCSATRHTAHSFTLGGSTHATMSSGRR